MIVPGPAPEHAPTNDPEPWIRPWTGERAADTGVNLFASGYIWSPRPEYDV